MGKKVEILKKMYLENKITLNGIKKALSDEVINEEEYEFIIKKEDE